MRGGAGAAIEMVQAHGEASGPGGAKDGGAVVVPSEGVEVRREGTPEVGVRRIGTEEVWELTPEDPAEGKRPTG